MSESIIPTLADQPRRFLRMRSERLHKLCLADAPLSILRAETNLVVQATNAVIGKEDPASVGVIGISGDPLQNLVNRCTDLLADVPGDTLEERLSTFIGWYLKMQIEVGSLRAAENLQRLRDAAGSVTGRASGSHTCEELD